MGRPSSVHCARCNESETQQLTSPNTFSALQARRRRTSGLSIDLPWVWSGLHFRNLQGLSNAEGIVVSRCRTGAGVVPARRFTSWGTLPVMSATLCLLFDSVFGSTHLIPRVGNPWGRRVALPQLLSWDQLTIESCAADTVC